MLPTVPLFLNSLPSCFSRLSFYSGVWVVGMARSATLSMGLTNIPPETKQLQVLRLSVDRVMLGPIFEQLVCRIRSTSMLCSSILPALTTKRAHSALDNRTRAPHV